MPSNHISNTDYHAWLKEQATQKTNPAKYMKVEDISPSKTNYVKADDIGEKEVTVTICSEGKKLIPLPDGTEEEKFVLGFSDAKKELICNQTNLDRMIVIFGSNETSNWVGGKITLITEPCTMNGQLTRGVRVKPGTAPQKAAWPAESPRAVDVLAEDDIPF